MKPLFRKAEWNIWVRSTLILGLVKRNYNEDKVTSRVVNCSVRVLLLPFWWHHSKIHSKLLFYIALMSWAVREQFRIHSFRSFSSTATSSALSECRTVPERPSWIEKHSSRNAKRTRNIPSYSPSPPQMKRSKFTCIFQTWNMNFYILIQDFSMNISNSFQLWKIFWSSLFTEIYCIAAGIGNFMCISNG